MTAIILPFGDHDRGEGAGPGGWATGRLQVPDVTRRAVPPFEGMTQTCEDVGSSRIRYSSSPTSNDSGLSSVFGGSSEVT